MLHQHWEIVVTALRHYYICILVLFPCSVKPFVKLNVFIFGLLTFFIVAMLLVVARLWLAYPLGLVKYGRRLRTSAYSLFY